MAALGLRCLSGLSLIVGSGGYSLAVVSWLLITVASLGTQAPAARGLRSFNMWALEHRLSSCAMGVSCSVACGIFPDQGLNSRPLHWQADSYPLRHQGSPEVFLILN